MLTHLCRISLETVYIITKGPYNNNKSVYNSYKVGCHVQPRPCPAKSTGIYLVTCPDCILLPSTHAEHDHRQPSCVLDGIDLGVVCTDLPGNVRGRCHSRLRAEGEQTPRG